MAPNLEETAQALVAHGKGLLAADERLSTLGKRFDALGIASTMESRRTYREMLFTTPGLAAFVSGVILFDETIRQTSAQGEPMAQLVSRLGMVPGIKVDLGAKPLAACAGERVTEGLDGLRERLRDYAALGARFAKWRAVLRIGPTLPSETCIDVNAHALARYAALCQEEGLVPVVEPEVLMDGAHGIARAEEVTGSVLERVFASLWKQRVVLEAMLLKPNMVLPGQDSDEGATPEAVAAATLRVLRRHVPAAMPGIVFLSGGQEARVATVNLNAINREAGAHPWQLSFSYGRALQAPALAAWGGESARLGAAQRELYRRARCNAAATQGSYREVMETDAAEEELTLH